MSDKKIVVGSRKSELALIQTEYVIKLLKTLHPDKEFEIVTMTTLGDKVLDIPLPKIGEKSLFTKELEAALSCGGVDFVVHSLKDLPTALPSGMVIGAVLTREDPRDALVLRHDMNQNEIYSLATMPKGSVIGTSSLRRTAQLARQYPHLKVANIRGNLNTRLKKLDAPNGDFQGILLAASGMKRMGWRHRITTILDNDKFLYAVGQGALAVECRENDDIILDLLYPLYDASTCLRIVAERSFLKTLGGGCSAPVAVATELFSTGPKYPAQRKLCISGAVWSLDGTEELKATDECILECCNVMKRCDQCPYKEDISAVDIESLCSNTSPIPVKRLKLQLEPLDESAASNSFSSPLSSLRGRQCPYLVAGGIVTIENDSKDDSSIKCPFLKEVIRPLPDRVPQGSNTREPHFCGLVPHIEIGLDTMRKAEKLGATLANILVGHGAKKIMGKAQATVHANS